MRKYVLDTNIFIEAKNRYYRFGICRGFWDFLRDAQGHIFSLDKVFEELEEGDDELTSFAKELRGEGFFKENDAFDCYEEIEQTLEEMEYKEEAIKDFMGKADFVLVAYAYKNKCIIVTHESASLGGSYSKKRVKIPDVCARLEIECIDTFDFLESERVLFVLNK